MNSNFNEQSFANLQYACRAFFSHKWQLSILCYLFSGPKHFGEILRYHQGLSKKVLSANLHKLEDKGVIQRHSYTEGAINRVEYSLTKEGEELQHILEALTLWGEKNATKISADDLTD